MHVLALRFGKGRRQLTPGAGVLKARVMQRSFFKRIYWTIDPAGPVARALARAS
jgi:hypothetical protein